MRSAEEAAYMIVEFAFVMEFRASSEGGITRSSQPHLTSEEAFKGAFLA